MSEDAELGSHSGHPTSVRKSWMLHRLESCTGQRRAAPLMSRKVLDVDGARHSDPPPTRPAARMSITAVPWFCAATTSCGARNFTCAALKQASFESTLPITLFFRLQYDNISRSGAALAAAIQSHAADSLLISR